MGANSMFVINVGPSHKPLKYSMIGIIMISGLLVFLFFLIVHDVSFTVKCAVI